MTATDTAVQPPTATFGFRCAMAGIGAAMGLCIGAGTWVVNQLSGQHHEVLVNTLVLVVIQGGIGFFVARRRAAWMDTILYFVLLGFLDG